MPLLWDLRDGDDDDDDEPRYHGDDDDDDSGGGGGGGGGDDDDSGDDDDDSGGGGDPGDQGDPGGGFDWGDNGDNGDNGDQGGDNGDSGGGFDYGDNGGGDSGWSAVQDYEDNGRTIRKFTDSSGTDYFQDVGEWGGSSRNNNDSSDFNWGDNNDQGNIFQDHGAREMPDVDPEVRDLHDYFHPYTISKYEDDPVRSKWGDGIASDGTRFDQQDEATRNMFQSSYGDTAPRSWAEQRSRDLEAEFRSRGVVTLPQQQEPQQPIFRPPPPVPGSETVVQPNTVLDLPRGSSLFGQEPTPADRQAGAESPIPPYTPPPAEAPPPTPEAEASPPQPQPPAPPAPPPGQQAAADAAARATAAAGGSSQQVADAAAAAALAYDRRNLSSESLDTQRQFGQAYGDQANERWVQQHNQELALNRALYGTAEPRAGSPQTGQIPGLGDVGPAPDRTIGRAQPAPWNRPTTAAPGAAGVSSTPSPGLTPGAVSAVTSTTHGLIDDLVRPPSAIYNGASPAQAQAVTSTTHGLIDDILLRPGTPATGGPSIDDSIRSAANIPNPNTGEVRGPTTVPPPLTGPQAAAYERGGVNPATGDIDVQATPEASLPGASPIPSDIGAPTQTMHEAGFEPASATIPIDASIRTAAGLPPAPDEQIEITEPIGNRHLLVPASRIGDFVGPGLAWQRVNPAPAPAPPPAAPPPPPPPAGPAIDASIRTAANVPFDPDLGPREGGRPEVRGGDFDVITELAAGDQGTADVDGFRRNVAAGIATGEAWAEPYTADLGRLAWYRETRGLEGGPDKAPDSYVRDWMGAFRAGNTNVPGVKEASQSLVDRGVAPPSNDPFGVVVSQAAREQGATDLTGFRRSVAGGIAKGEAWTRPYTEQLARQAWYRESGGREGGPERAPESYINDWTNALRAADTSVPGVKQVNQQLIEMGARVPSRNGQPFNWQAVYGPTGEGLGRNGPGLISQQSTTIDCGPNAFANIMRSQGYNAAPSDAFTFAKDNRYHVGGEFTGPDNFANMLKNELGLQATRETVNWTKIDQELAAGRLVTLSSPGHYWTISAKNDKGEYYTGATGTFVGNTAWSRPEQISYKVGGRPNDMITYSGTIDPNSRAVTSPTMKVKPPPTTTTPTMMSNPPTPRQMQSDEGASSGPLHALVAPEAQPAEERLWTPSPERSARMEQFEELPMAERERVFENAMDRGLAAEGITGADADYWKNSMRTVVTGENGENADLNPYMMAGESGGKRKTGAQSNSTALGYFQFLRQNPDGSHYSHIQYVPDEYKDRPYDPVGQVRQFVRAIKDSKKYRGDPGGVVRDKRTGNHTWGP